MKKTLEERIAAKRKRQEQLAAQVAAMEGKRKRAARKRDDRRKILVGAAVLGEMVREPKFADYVRRMLRKAITRPHDRDVLADLLATVAAEVTASPASSKPVPADPDPAPEHGTQTAASRAAAATQVTGHEQHPG